MPFKRLSIETGIFPVDDGVDLQSLRIDNYIVRRQVVMAEDEVIGAGLSWFHLPLHPWTSVHDSIWRYDLDYTSIRGRRG